MIKFILNNQIINTTVHSGVTLLDFIREYKQLKGTKIGCREGDCGACTVLVGTQEGDSITYQSITSCISPLGNANGKHIVTVEGINLPQKLNTVQEAMTNNYATQCGFCTPGFVMSMTGYALAKCNSSNTTEQSCNDAISGNICRCTGYKSIEKAGIEIEDSVQGNKGDITIQWLITKGFIPDYFKTIPKRLEVLRKEASESNIVNTGGVKVANGTDIYVRHADKMAEEAVHLLANKEGLRGIDFEGGICTIGSNTTVTELLENKKLRTLFPKLRQFLKLVSSEQIRNMGTIGGNFVNASPIGDMTIFFLALDASLTILKGDGEERKIPLQSFHQDYKVYDLGEDEVLKSISFTIPSKNDYFNFEKVSKRTHLDIASVNAAGKVRLEGSEITDAHFSVGGVAAVPKYLDQTSRFLKGKSLKMETIIKAIDILQSEISPISDVRGDSEYKRLLAKQLFIAHFIEMFPNQVELEKLISC